MNPSGAAESHVTPPDAPFGACADKVNEAYHFLLLMRVADLPPDGDGVPARLQGEEAFRYSLSAFLSAARTVLHLLQEEGVGVPGFTRWYVTAREHWLRDEATSFFGERREFRMLFGAEAHTVIAAPGSITQQRVGPAGSSELPQIDSQEHGGQAAFAERPGEAATEVCARYLKNLSTIVAQARQLVSR